MKKCAYCTFISLAQEIYIYIYALNALTSSTATERESTAMLELKALIF